MAQWNSTLTNQRCLFNWVSRINKPPSLFFSPPPTLLTLQEMSLVAPESPSEQARRVFQTFDPEGKTIPQKDTHHNNFTVHLLFKKEDQHKVSRDQLKLERQLKMQLERQRVKDGWMEWRWSNSMKKALDGGGALLEFICLTACQSKGGKPAFRLFIFLFQGE